jgi:hypothetical protein
LARPIFWPALLANRKTLLLNWDYIQVQLIVFCCPFALMQKNEKIKNRQSPARLYPKHDFSIEVEK